ncbi:YajQ family cyclic di-GMP-binding protein [Candidatus Saccharibacteria bacterium]|nr:YajQ family cyclic di-GMP-binding protein [Candidatus Saccharibacteria bacterium]
MATFSFDIVSEFDKAAMNNAVEGVQREVANRYDFKGTPAGIDWLGEKSGVKITGNNDWQIESILDILRKNLARYGLTSKFLSLEKPILTNNLQSSQEVPFVQGLDAEKAKQVTKLIRDKYPKAKPQIQGQMVRVTSGSKDELQNIMQSLRQSQLEFAVNFTNFR